MAFQHVHLGAGALGLGLICPVVVAAGGKCTILNRYSPSASSRLKAINDNRGYHIHLYGRDRTFVNVVAASTYEETDLEALGSEAGDLLLTTALKREGLLASVAVIRRILEERGARPTAVLAGENSGRHSFSEGSAGREWLQAPREHSVCPGRC